MRRHTPIVTVWFDTVGKHCRAYVKTVTTTHGGSGSTHAEALVNAAMHWLSHVRSLPPAPPTPLQPPENWQFPEWEDASRVHDWRNYVADIVQAMWSTFTDEQKQALAISAQQAADREEWD